MTSFEYLRILFICSLLFFVVCEQRKKPKPRPKTRDLLLQLKENLNSMHVDVNSRIDDVGTRIEELKVNVKTDVLRMIQEKLDTVDDSISSRIMVATTKLETLTDATRSLERTVVGDLGEILMRRSSSNDSVSNNTSFSDLKKDMLRNVNAICQFCATMKGDESYIENITSVLREISEVSHSIHKDIVQFALSEDVWKFEVRQRVVQEAALTKSWLSCQNISSDGYFFSHVFPIQSPVEPESTVDVFCDITPDGSNWLVIQRRQDGSGDFYRDWEDYKSGFGDLSREFWLGNDKIHKITSGQPHELYIELEDFEGETRVAIYGHFVVGPESDHYRLHIGNYSGTAGDSLEYHDGKPFSTHDQNNDPSGNPAGIYKCPETRYGAWWFYGCCESHLNGPYRYGRFTDTPGRGITWGHWKGNMYSIKRVSMKIRPK